MAFMTRGRDGPDYTFTIAPDGVATFPLNNGFFSLTSNGAPTAFLRVANPNAMNGTLNTGVVTTTGVLTGATGNVGEFSASVASGIVYLENRTVTALTVYIGIIPGFIA